MAASYDLAILINCSCLKLSKTCSHPRHGVSQIQRPARMLWGLTWSSPARRAIAPPSRAPADAPFPTTMAACRHARRSPWTLTTRPGVGTHGIASSTVPASSPSLIPVSIGLFTASLAVSFTWILQIYMAFLLTFAGSGSCKYAWVESLLQVSQPISGAWQIKFSRDVLFIQVPLENMVFYFSVSELLELEACLALMFG